MMRALAIATFAAALGACDKPHDTAAAAIAAAPAANANAAPATVLRRPLFWAAEKDGATLYFLGTMHLGIDAAAQLPPIVWAKLDAAPAFAMEANLDDPRLAELMAPTGRSLRQALGDDYWTKLEDALGPGVASAVEHLPPMVAANTLSSRGLPHTPAMDRVLAARASGEHKPVVYLEPATRQLQLVARWLDDKALKMTLDELPDSDRRARLALAAYVAGDEQAIVALNDGEKDVALRHGYTAAELDQEMTELLYDRNESWLPALDRMRAAGGGFVAVGALHLVGHGSVLERLAHQGYRVTRIAP